MTPAVQHIAITLNDGSLAIMQFVTRAEFEREATDEAIAAEIAKAGLDAQSWRRIDPEDIPADRTDRDAWQDTGKTIAVDPERKAILDAAMAAIRDPLAEIDAIKADLAESKAASAAQEGSP